MSFTHGITVLEQQTSIIPPVKCDSALPVAIGIAPINTGDTRNALAPKIAHSYQEAVSEIGFTANLEQYPLAQLTKAAFELYNIKPVIYINVLDPEKHRTDEIEITAAFEDNKLLLETDGILLDTLSLSNADGSIEYQPSSYTAEFENAGYVLLKRKKGPALPKQPPGSEILENEVKVRYRKVDPSKVTVQDALDGIQKIKEVYPRFGEVPGILLAPGFSQIPEVYAALTGQAENVGGMFRALVLADIDTKECDSYQKAYEWKNRNNYTSLRSMALYPQCRVAGQSCWMSAVLASLIAYTDVQYENIPAVSPSNKPFKISGLCGADGKEIIMDMEQASALNGQGIGTAINMNGWRFWGDRTAAFPGNTDVKDMKLSVRRMFDWQSNTFILTYFQKIDDPANYRLIESIVDSENIRMGGLKARGHLADAKIQFILEENPETSLIDGKITLHQMFTPYPAAENIVNILEYDVYALRDALAGAGS